MIEFSINPESMSEMASASLPLEVFFLKILSFIIYRKYWMVATRLSRFAQRKPCLIFQSSNTIQKIFIAKFPGAIF